MSCDALGLLAVALSATLARCHDGSGLWPARITRASADGLARKVTLTLPVTGPVQVMFRMKRERETVLAQKFPGEIDIIGEIGR